MIAKWSIHNCTLLCSCEVELDPNIIETRSNDLYIPSRILSYGLYELKLTVKIFTSSNLIVSKSAFVKIIPSGFVANLIESGTSIITRGNQQNLKLNPGIFSINLDGYPFDATVSLISNQ